MRVVLQRVKHARVLVDDQEIGAINRGVVLLFAVHKSDTKDKGQWLADKIAHLRIFENTNGKMDLSLQDVAGEALVISQFTLYADCTHGRRPDFFEAARHRHKQNLSTMLL